MATCYYRQFDVLRVTSAGVLTPLVSTTLTAYNETVDPVTSIGTVSVDANGIVAGGTFTTTVGDIVKFKHASYAGIFRVQMAATQTAAYATNYAGITFVVENLNTAQTAEEVDIWAQDVNNPNTPAFLLGTGRVGQTLEIPYQTTVSKDLRLYPIAKATKGLTQPNIDITNYQAITVTGTGGGGGTGDVSGGASSTDNAIARYDGTTGKIIQNSVVTVADTTGIIAGSQGINVAGSTSGAVNIRAAATAGSNTLTLPAGTTDFSATGGTGQVLKQTSAGGAITVAALLTADLPAGTGDTIGAASSTDNAIVRWDGTTGKIIQNSAPTIADTTGIISGTQGVNIAGSSSGAVNLRVPSAAGSNTLTFPAGTTDFSSTGGSTQFVRQNSSGGAFTVGAIAGNDLTTNLKTFYLNGTYGHTNSGLASAITAISTTRAKLVITEDLTVSSTQTIPATCVLSVENNAKITISSSATLTIGKFADPGNVQCFAGVDASNHVVFSAGAVEKFNLAWYMGIGSTSDCTYAMTDIFTSITTAKGGTVFVPPGSWKVNDLNCPNGLRLEGVGQGNDGSSDIGSRFIPRDGSTAYLFRTYRDYRNFSSAHIAFSVGTNTTTRAFRMEGSSGYSGFGVAFDHCTFIGNGATSHYPLVSDDNDQVYEIMRANFYDCQFMVANGSKGVYIKSVNTQFGFIGCSFTVGTGDSFGIDGYNAGLTVLNCDFRGASGSFNDAASTIATLTGSITSGTAALTTTSGLTKAMEGQRVYNASGLATGFYIKCVHSSTSATLSGNATSTITGGSITVYKWGDGTGRAGCAIRVASGALLTSTIDSCADEGFNYSLRVIGGSLDTPVRLTNNKIQSKIYAENSTVFYANGNEFYSNVWGIASGQVAHVYGENTYWDNTVEMAFSNPLTYAKPWGPERGGQFYFHDEGFMANAGGHTADRQGFWKEILETTSGSLTRPLLGVYTTYEDSSSNRQLLQQWGVKDAQGQQVVKYGLNLSRDVYTSPGYYLWESTQDAPYKGWQTDFPTGYGTACRGTVTQGTSRTTGVTLAAAHGIITCYTYAGTVLAPGETISFTLTNSFIQNSDFFHVAVIDNATSQYTKAWSSDCGGGVATINIKNEHLSNNENASALKLAFYIVKNGGQAGISV